MYAGLTPCLCNTYHIVHFLNSLNSFSGRGTKVERVQRAGAKSRVRIKPCSVFLDTPYRVSLEYTQKRLITINTSHQSPLARALHLRWNRTVHATPSANAIEMDSNVKLCASMVGEPACRRGGPKGGGLGLQC